MFTQGAQQAEAQQANGLVQRILNGTEHIVSHSGTSQYGGQEGISACGLACLNFARVIFAKEASQSKDDIIQTVISGETAQEITAICAGWTNTSHLEVDDIFQVPLFKQTLDLVSTDYGRPGLDQFTEMLQRLTCMNTSCAVIITRPPEIIACMKLVIDSTDVFVIFDSHSRPTHPDGAVFILNTSIRRTAAHLKRILPVDRRLLSDRSLQWEAQLLANFSGHTFVSRKPDIFPEHTIQTITESSLAILALRAEVSDLKLQISVLTSENKRLATAKQEGERLDQWANPFKHYNSPSGRWTRALIGNAVAGPSRVADRHSAKSIASWSKEPGSDKKDWRARKKSPTPKITRRHFECRICMEEHIEDNVARIDSCGHSFCRDCVKEYVGFKLGENRFPILCPVCMTEHEEREPGMVTNGLVQQIGINEEQYQIWIELEMAQYSILLHCRKCKRSTFVDRYDFHDMDIIVCPLPDCAHIWCKACQLSITLDGVQHSCDGTSELDHLMKERGWKYCPSCRTPFHKEAGCNHMTCLSPGCNTHFCYFCGESIVKSALPNDIQTATTSHFSKCKLFEDVADRGVPP